MKDQPSNLSGKIVTELPDEAEANYYVDDELLGTGDEGELQIKRIAAVWWEDITAYSRVEIPDDFDIFRLSKITVGLVWKETEDYVVLVQDYDLTNRGRGYRHNDFHIIPRGTIKRMDVMGEIKF